LALSEFELKFESAKAIKGQIIADFITEHHDPSVDLLQIEDQERPSGRWMTAPQ
jgi:hypothetical protein